MQRLLRILFFIQCCITTSHAQILYGCNFDTATLANSCLVSVGVNALLIDDKLGNPAIPAPTQPLSDVTSSLKPTTNGEVCILPYKVSPYTWDMYFCNNGYCPTSSNTNTRCTPGKFGHFNFLAPRLVSFTLNTISGTINGIDEQCLTYYYYLPSISGMQHNIKIRKEEMGGESEIINHVTSTPFNGWIKQQVNYNTAKSGYKLYFDLQKTSGPANPASIIGIDEISIHQGNCRDVTTPSTTRTSAMTTTTAEPKTTTSVSETTIPQTTITTTIEPLTTISSTVPTTIETTTTTTESSTTTTPVVDSTIRTSTTTIIQTTSSTTIVAESTMPPAGTTISISTTKTTPTATISTSNATTTTTLSTTSVLPNVTATDTTMITGTTIIIPIETSPIVTTTTTSTTTTTTIAVVVPTTASGDKPDDGPSNKTLIIALCTAIPVGLILFVGIAIWIKKSAAGGILKSISHPFTDIAHQDEPVVLELDHVPNQSSF